MALGSFLGRALQDARTILWSFPFIGLMARQGHSSRKRTPHWNWVLENCVAKGIKPGDFLKKLSEGTVKMAGCPFWIDAQTKKVRTNEGEMDDNHFRRHYRRLAELNAKETLNKWADP